MIPWLRARPWWVWVILGVAALLAAFGAGRFSAPTRIEVRTVTEWKERIVEKEVVHVLRAEGPVRIKRVIVERPVPGAACDTAGPVPMETVTTEEEDRGPVTVTTDETHDRDLTALGVTATEKIVTRESPRLTLGATIGYGSSLLPSFGGFLTYRVLGPMVVLGQGEGGAGVWSARAGLGVNF